MAQPQLEALYRAASRPFRKAGLHPWQFALWKLRLDPVFRALLQRGGFPDCGLLLDVGCGQGVLLALLVAAREQYLNGGWPRGWPAPPLNLELAGVERRADRVRAARQALRDGVDIQCLDARDFDFPPCSAITMVDVLVYLPPEDQQRLLEKAAGALGSGGLLFLREPDAAAGGFKHQMTRWSSRLSAIGHGSLWPELHCRSASEWSRALEALGFSVSAEPMSAGTPFANVLFFARRRA